MLSATWLGLSHPWLELSDPWLGHSDPGLALSDRWLGRSDPWLGLSDLWLGLSDLWLGLSVLRTCWLAGLAGSLACWLAGLSACRHGGSLACWAWPWGPRPRAPGQWRVNGAFGPYYPVNNIANNQQSIKESTYKTIHAYHNQTACASQPGAPQGGRRMTGSAGTL